MPQPIQLHLITSSDLRSLADELATTFMNGQPYVIMTVGQALPKIALEAVRTRQADVALIARAPGDTPDNPLEATRIGYEAIAVAVHPSNPIHALSWDQVRDIFSGQIWDWAVPTGGEKVGEILVVSQHAGAAARIVFENRVMQDLGVTPRAVVAVGDDGTHDLIAQEPAAIGYVSTGVDGDTVKILTIGGVMPSPATVAAHTWPLSRPLVLVSHQDANVYVLDFVDFVLSDAGQAVVGRHYGRAKQREK